MKPAHVILGAVVAVSIGYGAYRAGATARPHGVDGSSAVGLGPGTSPHEGSKTPSSGPDDLRPVIAALQAKVESLDEQLAARQKPDAPAGPAEVVPDPDIEVREARQRREHMDAVQADFEAERRDAQWAGQTKTAVQRAADSAGSELAAAVRSIDCRSSSCRVEVADNGAPAIGKLVLPFINGLGSTLPFAQSEIRDDGRGNRITIFYLSTHAEGE